MLRVAALERLEQQRDVGRRVLEIRVEDRGVGPARFGEPGAKRRALAAVAVVREHAHVLRPRAVPKDIAGPVARAVVDDDQLIR